MKTTTNHSAAALAAALLLGTALTARAQTRITLPDAVRMSLGTEQAAVIRADSTLNAIASRQFRIRNLPRVSLSGTLPGLTNSIQPITMTDGSEQFVQRYYMSTSANLTVSQNVPFTGGTLALSGGISRLDNFVPERRTSFSTSLFNLSYSQSLSLYNPYRWDKRIQRMRESAYATGLARAKEGVRSDAVSLFFDLLSAQKQAELTEGMLRKAEAAARRAERLREHNKNYATSLLDAKIDLARLKASTAPLQLTRARVRLAAALGVADTDGLTADFDIDSFSSWVPSFDAEAVTARAIQYALQQDRDIAALGEDQQIARQKALALPSVSVSVGAGMNSAADALPELLDLPSRSTSATISLTVPILNWGENRLALKELREKKLAAEARYEIARKEFEAQCRYELQSLGALMENIRLDGETLAMLSDKLDRLTDRAEYGKTDLLEINETRNQILQTESQRISRIKSVFATVYKYRQAALWDVYANRPVLPE